METKLKLWWKLKVTLMSPWPRNFRTATAHRKSASQPRMLKLNQTRIHLLLLVVKLLEE